MKKYYGPIVLGLAALTVGAVATQTTVKAEGETSGEVTNNDDTATQDPTDETPDTTTPGDDTGSSETDKDADLTQDVTLKAIDVDTGKEMDIKVGSVTFDNYDVYKTVSITLPGDYQIVAQDDKNNNGYLTKKEVEISLSKNGTITVDDFYLNSDGLIPIRDFSSSNMQDHNPDFIKAELTKYTKSLNDFNKTLNELNGSTPTLETTQNFVNDAIKNAKTLTPTSVKDVKTLESALTDKENSFNSTVLVNDVTVKDSSDKTITIANVPIEAGTTTTGIDVNKNNSDLKGTLSLDKDNKVTVTSTDGNITLADDSTATTAASASNIAAIKKSLESSISALKNAFTSSNASALADLTKSLEEKSATINDNISAKDLNDIKDFMSKNLTTVSVTNNDTHNTTIISNVPLLKDATVYTSGFANEEYFGLTFDKDGLLSSATTTDKDHNVIDKNITAWIGNAYLDSNITPPDETEKPTNNNNSGNNNSSNNKKPVVTPEHTKTIVDHPTTFYVLPNNLARLYNENGNLLTGRALGGNSSWYADKLLILDGVSYLRVATGEFAKLNDGLEVTPLSQNVVTANNARLYTATGELIGNRGLAKNTPWRTDKSATINGQKMYRVATNEWVRAADLK